MENGIEIEYNGEKGFILLNAINTKICYKQEEYEILHNNLKSVFVKDAQTKDVDTFPYYLKIITIKNEQFVVSFKTDYIREVFKIFMLNVIKAKPDSSKNDENKYLNMLAEMHELPKLENTKSSLIEYLVSNSVLILIYYEMNCTLSQFYNYIKQSYFYDIKNSKNVIDRLLNEKLRNFTISKDTYATRLNNFSFLSMNDRKESTIEEKIFEEKKYKFVPIYAQEKVKEKREGKHFVMPQKITLTYDYNPEEQEICVKKDYDKKILQELLNLCKVAYSCKPEDVSTKEHILKVASEYTDILKDPSLTSFNPTNYFSKYTNSKYNA
ncbi:hypothetical protein BDAP_000192 [Binucleata daphniae]